MIFEFDTMGHMKDMDEKTTPYIPMDLRISTDSPYYRKIGFNIRKESVFQRNSDALVNSINCIGVMGAGIALEFKKVFPKMYADYKIKCNQHLIKPGDAYLYKVSNKLLIGLAVKDDWRHWSTLEWLESSIKSLKLAILENDVKSVNLPVLGGKNGRRGPFGKVVGMTPPPEHDDIVNLLRDRLESFANKFEIEINLCIPELKSSKVELKNNEFFGY